jgi:hypothetical protein
VRQAIVVELAMTPTPRRLVRLDRRLGRQLELETGPLRINTRVLFDWNSRRREIKQRSLMGIGDQPFMAAAEDELTQQPDLLGLIPDLGVTLLNRLLVDLSGGGKRCAKVFDLSDELLVLGMGEGVRCEGVAGGVVLSGWTRYIVHSLAL